MILSTAITGGYMTVRGISFLIGGFPSEFLIFELVRLQKFEEIPWSLDAYFCVMLFLSVSGIYVQYELRKEKKKEELTYIHPYTELSEKI